MIPNNRYQPSSQLNGITPEKSLPNHPITVAIILSKVNNAGVNDTISSDVVYQPPLDDQFIKRFIQVTKSMKKTKPVIPRKSTNQKQNLANPLASSLRPEEVLTHQNKRCTPSITTQSMYFAKNAKNVGRHEKNAVSNDVMSNFF